MTPAAGRRNLAALPTFDPASGDLNVIIETPMGSRSKYAYDPEQDVFLLKHFLPAGVTFPYNFGFAPSTRAGDGDPEDVLLLLEAPAVHGSLAYARLVGVFAAEQTETDGQTERNDRLVAVACESQLYRDLHKLSELPENLLNQIQEFFVYYNRLRGKQFRVLGVHGPAKARQLLEASRRQYARQD